MMIDITNDTELLGEALNNIRKGMAAKVYVDAMHDIDMAERYRKGHQIPGRYRGDPKFFALSLTMIDTDLQRLAGMSSSGARDTRFYPRDGWTSELQSYAAEELESWQYYDQFSRKMGWSTYRQFDQGFVGGRLVIDPTIRYGDDLPGITLNIPDGRQWVIDPASDNPLDPMLGARWAACWEPITVDGILERYGGRDFKTPLKKAMKLAKESDEDSYPYQFAGRDVHDHHPLRHILRNLVQAQPQDWTDDFTSDPKYDDKMLAGIDYVKRVVVRYQQNGEERKRQTWVRLYIVTQMSRHQPVKGFEHAVLMEARLLDLDGFSPYVFATAEPPYGKPLVAQAASLINERNYVRNAGLALISELVKQGNKYAVLRECWDDKQRIEYETHNKTPEVYNFSAEKLERFTGTVNVNHAIQQLSTNFTGLGAVMQYSEIVDKQLDDEMGGQWTVTGDANPSSRFSGAAISLMQNAVKLNRSIIAEMVQAYATNVSRVAFATMKKTWASPHRIMNRGFNAKRMNEPVSDPSVANVILNRGLQVDGEDIRINAVGARHRLPDGSTTIRLYPIPDSLTDVRDHDMVQRLVDQEDVEKVFWVANALSMMDTDLEILVELDSVARDQENMSRLELAERVMPGVTPDEIKWEMIMGANSRYTWADAQRMNTRNSQMQAFANLTDEQVARIMPFVTQLQEAEAEQGQVSPGSGQAALPAA